MIKQKKWLAVILVALIAIGAGAWFGIERKQNVAQASVEIIADVGDFVQAELPDTLGTVKPVSQSLGKVNLVNFWATWCVPCREEMPVFEQAYLRYQDRGFVVIGLTIDEADRAETFLQQLGISYPVFMVEEQGWDLLERFGNSRGLLPYSILIDNQGRVLEQKLGVVHNYDLDAWAEKYLN